LREGEREGGKKRNSKNGFQKKICVRFWHGKLKELNADDADNTDLRG
jgi:hypothetical protein